MPVGAQCVSRMPSSWPWNTGRPWWPDWVTSAIDGPARSSRNCSNALRFVLGPSRRTSPLWTRSVRRASRLLALLAGLGEAGGEDHRELGLAGEDLFEGVDGLAGEDDREVDVAGDVEDRLVDLVAEHRLVGGVHRVEGGAVLLGPRRRTSGSSRCSACATAPDAPIRAIVFGARNASRSTSRSSSGRPETSVLAVRFGPPSPPANAVRRSRSRGPGHGRRDSLVDATVAVAGSPV